MKSDQNFPFPSIETGLNFNEETLEHNIKLWEKFLATQPIIEIISEEYILELKKVYDLAIPLFAVKFPLNYLKNTTTQKNFAVAFYYSGTVSVLMDGVVERMTYYEAWRKIFFSVTGKDLQFLLSLEVPHEGIIREKILVTREEIHRRIHAWIEELNKIPAVTAYQNAGNNAENIILIDLPGSADSFIRNEPPTIGISFLTNNRVDKDYYCDESIDSIAQQWKKAFEAEPTGGWDHAYRWIIKLIESYKDSVPNIPL